LLETPALDGARTLWIGTRGGLARHESGEATVRDTRSGFPSNDVPGVLDVVSPSGARHPRVGTSGGAARLDLSPGDPTWLVYSDTTAPALPNNTVYQVRADARGRI
jgi:hypothetical protein